MRLGKPRLLALASVLTSSLAVSMVEANDAGIVGIKVETISVANERTPSNPMTPVEDSQVDVPRSGLPDGAKSLSDFVVEIGGGEARKLMRVLPAEKSVLTFMYPGFKKTFEANFRTLAITAGMNQPAVTIRCRGGELAFGDDGRPMLEAFTSGVKCRIEVSSESYEDGLINFSWDPKREICRK